MKKMLAFHNKEEVKKLYLSRVKAHYVADEIIHGKYWVDGKGCAVGCTVETGDNAHQAMETELGIPRTIAYLEDRIFEGLTNGEAKEFPLKFLRSIKVGADLSKVTAKFMIWLLVDKKDGVFKYARPDGKKAIKEVARLYRLKLKGVTVRKSQWQAARHAAYAAAAAAADAAAYAAAADAAADAAYAAAAAAAYAAAAYAAAADARQKHYKKMAKKLLQLLKEAK